MFSVVGSWVLVICWGVFITCWSSLQAAVEQLPYHTEMQLLIMCNLRCADKHSPAPDLNSQPRAWEAGVLVKRLKSMGACACWGVRFTAQSCTCWLALNTYYINVRSFYLQSTVDYVLINACILCRYEGEMPLPRQDLKELQIRLNVL